MTERKAFTFLPLTRQVRAKVIPNVDRETLQNEILACIAKKSTVYTDK